MDDGPTGGVVRDYVEAVAERDINLPDGVRRAPELVRLLMAAYAHCTATQAARHELHNVTDKTATM